MATRLALEYMRNKEDKRHNIVSENLGAGNLAVNAVSAGAGAIKSIGDFVGKIAAIAAGNPDMYRHNNNAIEVATQKAYYTKKGQPVDFRDPLIDAGIVIADIIPTIGTLPGTDSNTPFQAMFQQVFSTQRGKNSGAVNYDFVDLGQATLGLDSMRMIYEDVWRALDLAKYSEQQNSYTISTLLKALGYDINYLNANRTEIITVLNKFAIDMGGILLPGNLDYIKRHSNLAGVVFVDNPGVRRNYYAYCCRGYFVYDELNAALVWRGDESWKHSVNELQQVLDTLKTKYLFSDAISIMSGDVEKAIENKAMSVDSVFKFPVVNLDYGEIYHKDLFCMNELDLSSFRNMRIFSIDGVDQSKQYSIRQYVNTTEGNFFIYQGELNASHKAAGVMVHNPVNADGPKQGSPTPNLFARSDYDNPSSDSIIEDTRLLVPYYDATFPGANQTLMPIGTHCSEICVGLHIWAYTTKTNWNNNSASDYFIDSTYFLDQYTPGQNWIMRLLSNIPYLPAIIVFDGQGDEFTLTFAPYYNAIVYDANNLASINDLALRSLLYYDPKGSSMDNPSRRNAKDNTPLNEANQSKNIWGNGQDNKGKGGKSDSTNKRQDSKSNKKPRK